MSADPKQQVLDYPFRTPTGLAPPEEFQQLRQGCPVAHVRLPSGDQAVLLTRYDDVITEDVELKDGTLPKGTTVVCNLSAANRDEQAFDHADEMDLRRSPNTHIAFVVGPHSCLGQALARTELQTVLEVLLRRLPSLELAIPPEQLPRREGLIVGGLEKVPVRW
jgi:hypothetical protein